MLVSLFSCKDMDTVAVVIVVVVVVILLDLISLLCFHFVCLLLLVKLFKDYGF